MQFICSVPIRGARGAISWSLYDQTLGQALVDYGLQKAVDKGLIEVGDDTHWVTIGNTSKTFRLYLEED